MIHWLMAAGVAAALGAHNPAGTLGRNAWRTEGDDAQGWYGWAVASAGDVNGDGYADLLVGAPFRDDGQGSEAGRAELFLGGPQGLAPTPAWRADGIALQHVGGSLASGGDVNGDGYDDVLVGAPGHSSPAVAGRVWLFLGSARGLSALPDRTFVDPGQADSAFGGSVASAGDVNGDGYDDVMVGAYNWAIWNGDFSTRFGRAYVYHGSASGLSPSPALVLTGGVGDDYGFSVGTAGDVDGDGFDDVIIGAPERSVSLPEQGGAVVHHGSAAGLSATPAWSTLGPGEGQLLGHSVATAGDVNGDGYADVIVGVPWFPGFPLVPEFVGRAMVFVGSPSGLSAEPAWHTTGRVAFGNLGRAVAPAGDTDGDGFDDVAIGVPFEDTALSEAGAAWVRMGSFYGVR